MGAASLTTSASHRARAPGTPHPPGPHRRKDTTDAATPGGVMAARSAPTPATGSCEQPAKPHFR